MKSLISILSVVSISLFTLYCGVISNKVNFVEPKINKDSLLNIGMPERITNQYITIRKSFDFQNKSFFIVDTRENLIFFFDKNGNFVAKSPTIDGFDKQNNDSLKVTQVLQKWTKHASDAGFKWDKTNRKYTDTTGKNRIYSTKIVYDFLGKNKRRFFPKGIYEIESKQQTSSFLGNDENTYNIQTLDGKPLAIAIHSLYKSQYRINSMNYLKTLIGNKFDEIKVSDSYKKVVIQNINNGTFNNSFGCINVPLEFISITKNMAIGSLIFVLGENEKDYLVE
jgi:hypothetical protein